MEISNAEFDRSSERLDQCPVSDIPEYAFIGRSNVGKSSLINMLTNKKGLAKTSSKPGKTKLINHFIITDDTETSWYLVDLPGYGYASVSKVERAKWSVFIDDYILNRPQLINLFVLIDSRIPLQKIDLDFINWLGFNHIPFSLVMTKTDKLTKNELRKGQASFAKALGEYWENLPEIILTSATEKLGKSQLIDRIGEINASL